MSDGAPTRCSGNEAAVLASIAAFFVVRGKSPVTSDLGYSIVVDVTKAHRQFLGEYDLTSKDVPLVSFDPGNWEEPFSEYRG